MVARRFRAQKGHGKWYWATSQSPRITAPRRLSRVRVRRRIKANRRPSFSRRLSAWTAPRASELGGRRPFLPSSPSARFSQLDGGAGRRGQQQGLVCPLQLGRGVFPRVAISPLRRDELFASQARPALWNKSPSTLALGRRGCTGDLGALDVDQTCYRAVAAAGQVERAASSPFLVRDSWRASARREGGECRPGMLFVSWSTDPCSPTVAAHSPSTRQLLLRCAASRPPLPHFRLVERPHWAVLHGPIAPTPCSAYATSRHHVSGQVATLLGACANPSPSSPSWRDDGHYGPVITRMSLFFDLDRYRNETGALFVEWDDVKPSKIVEETPVEELGCFKASWFENAVGLVDSLHIPEQPADHGNTCSSPSAITIFGRLSGTSLGRGRTPRGPTRASPSTTTNQKRVSRELASSPRRARRLYRATSPKRPPKPVFSATPTSGTFNMQGTASNLELWCLCSRIRSREFIRVSSSPLGPLPPCLLMLASL